MMTYYSGVLNVTFAFNKIVKVWVGPTNLGVEGVPFNFDSMGEAYFFPPIIKKCKETLVC